MLLYSFALAAALTFSSPLWLWRMLRQRRYREGLGDRLGRVPSRLSRAARKRPTIWLHAVSVGEVLAAGQLVAALERALPEYCILVSTTTSAGQQIARERFGKDRVFFYPLDFAFAARAYLRALQPHLLVLLESELWPRMLVECERLAIPVAVVNARVSDRSLPRYIRLRPLWRPFLRKISLLLAQSDEDARRWQTIGVPSRVIRSSGNLKYDIPVHESSPLSRLLRHNLPQNARVLVCGSTHQGEETLLLQCWARMKHDLPWWMVLAPRHPHRCDAVAAAAAQMGLSVVRLSRWRDAPEALPSRAVLLLDTVGELAALYSLASLAFVGGSLVSVGGHNPLEPALCGIPVLTGPHVQNFRAVVDAMLAGGAMEIVRADTLCSAVELRMHDQSGESAGMGARARAFALSQRGATQRTVEALLSLLQAER